MDDDILQQWRLRRKMELAREGPQLFPNRDPVGRSDNLLDNYFVLKGDAEVLR